MLPSSAGELQWLPEWAAICTRRRKIRMLLRGTSQRNTHSSFCPYLMMTSVLTEDAASGHVRNTLRPMVNVTTAFALNLWYSSGTPSVNVCTASGTGGEMLTVQGHFFATSSSSLHKRELRVQCEEKSWVTCRFR